MEKKQESIFSFIFLKNLASFRNVKFWVQDLVISSDNESGSITWILKLHLNFPSKSHGTGAISFSCSAQKKKEKSKEYLIFLRFCMLLLTLQKSKPRASLLISVLLKCVARKKKSQHTVCQIERIQIVWEKNFAGRTLKGEITKQDRIMKQ